MDRLDGDSWHSSTLPKLAFFDVTPCHHVMPTSFFRVQRSSSEFVIFSVVLPHFEFAMQTDDMKFFADHAIAMKRLLSRWPLSDWQHSKKTNFTLAGMGLVSVQDECRVHYGNKKHLGPNWIASGAFLTVQADLYDVPSSLMSNELMVVSLNEGEHVAPFGVTHRVFFRPGKEFSLTSHQLKGPDTCQVGQWPIMGCKCSKPWSKESLIPRKRSRTVSLGREQEDDWRPIVFTNGCVLSNDHENTSVWDQILRWGWWKTRLSAWSRTN